MRVPNDESIVFLGTLSIAGRADGAVRDAVEAAVRSHGGNVAWRSGERANRSYALFEVSGEDVAVEIARQTRATLYRTPVIALAVFPSVPEALQPLRDALAGPGRPEGLLATHPCDGGVVVEWDFERVSVRVVMALVDVELRRFNSGRTAELLSPLAPAWVARIAADGLLAPEIAPDRVLELLLQQAGVHA